MLHLAMCQVRRVDKRLEQAQQLELASLRFKRAVYSVRTTLRHKPRYRTQVSHLSSKLFVVSGTENDCLKIYETVTQRSLGEARNPLRPPLLRPSVEPFLWFETR